MCRFHLPFLPFVLSPFVHATASLFNHSSSPNVNFIRNTTAGTITFTTSRAVEPNEELCICYSADESKLWFLPTDQRPRPMTPSDDGDGSERLAAIVLSDDETEAERAAAKAKEAAREKARQTRREQGGSTHSAKELRREKWRKKMEKQKNAGDIVAPQPVRAASLLDGSAEPSPSTSEAASTPASSSAVVIPKAADLPPMLHSDSTARSRHEHVGPVVITPDLEWADAGPSEVPEAKWPVLRRAKGPVEYEEEAEDDNSAKSKLFCECRS